MLDHHDISGITTHCVDKSRKRIPFFRDLPTYDAKAKLEQAIHCSLDLGLVFPNPKQDGQYIVYASFHDVDLWVVVGPSNSYPGKWCAITIFRHKPQHFSEELDDVRRTLEQNVGEAA